MDEGTVPPGSFTETNNNVGAIEDWIHDQPATLELEEKLIDKSKIVTRDSGLMLYETADNVMKILVPVHRRKALWQLEHITGQHLNASKNLTVLKRSYWWPKMRSDIQKWYLECRVCEIGNAKRNLMHKRWRAVQGTAPRKRWCMDFHGVADKHVLGVIDKDSLHIELFGLDDRSAEGVARCIRDTIVFRHGAPVEVTSDHAREFIGRVMQDLAVECKFRIGTTKGHNATGNALIERFWAYMNKCLRALTDEQYLNFKEFLQRIAWGWNSSNSESLTVSPFNVMTGCIYHAPSLRQLQG